MSNLPKYTLTFSEERERWILANDRSNRIVKTFERKSEATRHGVLRGAVGARGGSVKIQKGNGRFQEERTYPRSRDPRRSRG